MRAQFIHPSAAILSRLSIEHLMSTQNAFQQLGLPAEILSSLDDLGYETPSPIQSEAIPVLLAGHDVIAQAQTGTGKTAAFALPLLSKIDTRSAKTQVLVLAPTRELAIQVAEAFSRYSAHQKNVNVLAIYGGQDYSIQIKALKRGAHVVVGTPGRVMDHMRRKTLLLDGLQALVLDEADEMLRMGFIDDVKWVLEQTPDNHQSALFSATMPAVIRRIAEEHLTNPKHIKIVTKTATAENIRQRYWLVQNSSKLDAISRILESENTDACLVFVRTRNAVEEMQQQLTKRGFKTDALHGDIPQKQRERIVERLRSGDINILVATDVVARGLDVDRISHVINYDIPTDTEAYIHRIGRTGRAGRSGEAISFVSPRERGLLRAIEKTARHKIEPMDLPGVAEVNEKRKSRFQQSITEALAAPRNRDYLPLLEELQQQLDVEPLQIAAALAGMLHGDRQLFLHAAKPASAAATPAATKIPRESNPALASRPRADKPRLDNPRAEQSVTEKLARKTPESAPAPDHNPRPLELHPDVKMVRYYLSVGHSHGVKPGNIVGAIANEADIDSEYIGYISIQDTFSTVDLPEGMPDEIMQHLHNTRLCGTTLGLRLYTREGTEKPARRKALKPIERKAERPIGKPATGIAKKPRAKRKTPE